MNLQSSFRASIAILLSFLIPFCTIGQTTTFNYTGSVQTYTVPAGVTEVFIEAWGAQGGNGTFNNLIGTGGEGGFASGNLLVTPGEILHVYVGGQGTASAPGGYGGGGFNGGGDSYSFSGYQNGIRAGGGGASDVRQGGIGLADRQIVAGGGGGACCSTGGCGGGLSGLNGGYISSGGGGTQASGGGSGCPSCCLGSSVMNGSLGQGGSVPVGCTNTLNGGGGGYYGGGAGNDAGGGSSYLGGVTNGFTSACGRQGHGLVQITVTDPCANDTEPPTLTPVCLNPWNVNETTVCPANAAPNVNIGDIVGLPFTLNVGGSGAWTTNPGCFEDNCTPDTDILLRVNNIIYSNTDLPCDQLITVIFDVGDDNGNWNVGAYTINVTVEDVEAPSLTPACLNPWNVNETTICPANAAPNVSIGQVVGLPFALNVGGSGSWTTLPACFEDNCVSNTDILLRVNDIQYSNVGLPCDEVITVIFDVGDGCDNWNIGAYTINVTVEDTEAPTLTPACLNPWNVIETTVCPANAAPNVSIGQVVGLPFALNVGGSGSWTTLPACFQDNCVSDTDILLRVNDIQYSNAGLPCDEVITVIFDVGDGCDNWNIGAYTINVTVEDVEAPTLTPACLNPWNVNETTICPANAAPNVSIGQVVGLPFALNVGGSGSWTTLPACFQDNCVSNTDVLLRVNDIQYSNVGLPCDEVITVIFDVGDGCDNWNIGAYTINVTVEDNQAPTLTPACLNPWNVGDNSVCPANAAPNVNIGDIVGLPFTLDVGGTGGWTTLPACFQDNCVSDTDILLRVNNIIFSNTDLPCEQLITVIFDVGDGCDNWNIGAYTINVTVEDTEAPTLTPACLNPWNVTDNTVCPADAQPNVNIGDIVGLPFGLNVGGTNTFNTNPGCFQDNCVPNTDILLRVNNIIYSNTDLPCEQLITLIFDVGDGCDNWNIAAYTINVTIEDLEAPTITSAPGVFDQTINLTDPLGSCPDEWQSIGWGGGNTTITFQDGSSYTFFADVQGADNCDNDLDIEGCFTSCGQVSFDGCTAVYESGWRLRDDCGNLSDETYIVRYTFVDAAPPQITSAPGAFDQTINLTDPNGSCPDEWQSISWGNGTTTITFQDGSVYSLNANIQGTDNCDNTFSIEGCFTSCGLVSFDGCSAVYESTWRLDDGCGNLSEDYVVRYTFVDQADPVITSAPGAFDQTINLTDPFGSCPDEWQSISWGDGTTTITFQDGSVYSFDANIQGFDNCDDNLTISGCFTSCGLVSSDECSAVYESGWRLEDDCGNITDDTYIVRYTFVDAAPPVIDPQAMNMTVECDGQGNTDEFDAWIADNGGADGADACTDVTWSVQSQNFTPDCGATGIWNVTFALTDECGNTSTTSALFIIEDTTPPQMTEEAADEVVECDGMGNVGELQAWLANNGGADAYDRCGAEIWSNDYDPANFVPLCGNTGYVDVTFTVEDECGNVGPSTTARFEIVDTTPPSIDVPASDLEVACGEKTATANQTYWLDNLAGAQASDICSNVTWSYELLTENEICESTGSVTFAFTATDDCGNSSATIATYTKYDQAPPEIYLPFAEKEQACGTEPDWGYVYAEDECDLDVINMTWTETYEEGDCDHAYSISRTWIAMDDCGNMTSATQTITYDDDDAPELSFTEDSQFYGLADGDTYVVDCADLLPFNEQDVVAEDNCTVGFMQVSMEGGREFGNCNDDGYIERWPWTFTAEDECGNVGSLSITIELVDNSAPVFVLVPDDKTIGCNDEVEFDEVQVEDDCNTRFQLTFEDVVEDTACPDTYYERTWTAIDVCGNESSATQRIAQLDQDPPVFVTVPDDQTLGCDADPDWGDPEVTDGCGTVDVTFVDDDMMGDCDTGYTITRTWIATDECGNTSTAQTVVLIIDNSIIVDRNSENNDPDRETGGPSTAVLRDKPNTDTEELAIDHRLYPNPVEWELTVEWASPEPGDWSIEVRNMHGQLVAMDNIQADTGLAKYQLEVDKYEAGMYFITVRSGERTWSDRFIKL